jgi:hypothetical protein
MLMFALFKVSCYLALAVLHWLHERLTDALRERLLAVLYLSVAVADATAKLLPAG